jgi:hypothetical protein
MLTEVEGQFVVFTPCDAENPHITISEDRTALTVAYGHDAVVYAIRESTLKEKLVDGIIGYKLTLMVQENDVTTKVTVEHVPDRPTRWSGLPWKEGTYFANEGEVDEYPSVVQPCRECWGDECED